MHAAIAAAAVALLLPAHASVIGSTPADGSTVGEQPGAFSVVLSEEIIDVPGAESANGLRLTDASGLHYGDGCSVVDGDTITIDAELGAAGDYTLSYRVVSSDGHPVSGEIGFAFEPTDGTGAVGSAAAPVCGAAPAATSDQGEPIETDEPAADAGGQPPLLAFGVLAVLAVLAVIAYRTDRLRTDRAGDA